MKTASSTRPESSVLPGGARLRWVKAVVWLLLVVVLAVGASLTQGTTSGTVQSQTHSSVTTQTPAPGTVIRAQGEEGTMVLADETPIVPDPALGKFYVKGSNNTTNLLPAWRWKSSTGLYSKLKMADVPGKAMTFIASALLSLAALIWGILLSLLKLGLTLNLVNDAAVHINTGFKGFTANIWGSGIVILILVAGLFVGGKMALKGQGAKLVPLMCAMIIPIAMMQALSVNAAKASVGNESPKGSPSWFAQTGVGMIDSLGTSLGRGFGLVDGVGLRSAGEAGAASPDCYTYKQKLYEQYSAYSAPHVELSDAEEKAIQRGGAERDKILERIEIKQREALNDYRSKSTVANVSYLWERAYLGFYQTALLSAEPGAERIICHALEDGADIPADEQLAIAKAAGYQNPKKGVFISQSGQDYQAAMLAWAACSYTGEGDGTEVTSGPAWKLGDASDDECKDWWENGKMDKLKFDNPGDIKETFSDSKVGENGVTQENLNEARRISMALQGGNGPTRFLNGIVAVLTAGVYAWALGALAIGAIGAQLGLLILLILFPATLLLLALPTAEKGRHPAGRRLLRLTGSFMAAKLVITVVMVLLIQTIMTFEAVLGGGLASATAMGGTGSTSLAATAGGGAAGIMHAIIPLVSLFLMKWLLKQAGLGDITKLTGAMGMTAAAAMAAGGDSKGRGGWSAAQGNKFGQQFGGSKLGLGLTKADRMSKTGAKMAGKWAGKKAVSPGVKAGKAIGRGTAAGAKELAERGQYGNRLAALRGRKDEDGNVVERGLKQRLMAGAAAKGYGGLAALPVPGKKVWERRKNAAIDRRDMAAIQRADLKSHIAAVKGKSREERAQLAGNRFLRAEDAIRASMRGKDEELERDDNGNLVWDPERGFKILKRDSDNNIIGERYAPRGLSFTAAQSEALAYADQMDLKEQQVILSQLGMGSTFVPTLRGNSDTAVLVQAKTENGSADLARDVLQYLPDSLKARRPGWSDDQYNMYLHGLRIAAGGVDPENGVEVDWAKANGIDLDTEVGKIELRKCLNGEASKFDAIQGNVEVSAASVQALVTRVSRVGKGGVEHPSKVLEVMAERELDAAEGGLQTQELLKESKGAANSTSAAKQQASEEIVKRNQAAQRYEATQKTVESVTQEVVELEATLPTLQGKERASAETKVAKLKLALGDDAVRDMLQSQIAEADQTLESVKVTVEMAERLKEKKAGPEKALKNLELRIKADPSDEAARGHAEEFKKQIEAIDAQLQRVGRELSKAAAAKERKQNAEIQLSGFGKLIADLESARNDQEEHEKQMRDSLSTMLEDSFKAVENAMNTQYEAKALDLNFDMFLADKKGKGFADILDAADTFEKQFDGMKAAAQQQVLVAQDALMKAMEKGDVKEIRVASEDLDRITKRIVQQADAAATKALGNQRKISAEAIEQAGRDFENNARYGSAETRRSRGRDVVGAGTPFK